MINAFIDCLDKKWGEQAMQRKIDEKDRAIEEKDRAIAEKERAIEDRKRTIETLRENRAKADDAWARAFAERTGGTIRTNPPLQ